MKKTIYLVAGLLIFTACGGSSIEVKKQDGNITSSVEAGGQSEAELNAALKEVQKEEDERLKKEMETYTTLSFNEIEHNYGDVKSETDNETNFIVTNTGKKPLIIEKVEASCGCTTPEKPEKPILPGKSDKIKVVFHPKPGQVGEQNKTITVTSNTNPRMNILKIKAFVK